MKTNIESIRTMLHGKVMMIVQDKNGNYSILKNWRTERRKNKITKIYENRI